MSTVTNQKALQAESSLNPEQTPPTLAYANSQVDALLAQAQSPANTPHSINATVEQICNTPRDALQEKEEKIRDLFFHTLRSCAYDRNLITKGSALEAILDPEIAAAHQGLDIIDSVTSRRIHETVAEALFALRLGMQPEKAPSTFHTIYYLLDRSGLRLGVFKPAIHVDKAEDDRYGGCEDREAHLAEVANSTLDQWLGTKLVPHTQLIRGEFPSSSEVKPCLGSFQLYIANTPDLDALLEVENPFDPDHSALTKRLDIEANRLLSFCNFQEFALLDFLSANNDHHFKNILVKQIAEKTYNLIAIDNTNSFPWCHDADRPEYKMQPLHSFKWSTLPHAEQPFSEEIIERINTLDLDAMIAELRQDLVHPQATSSYEHLEGKITTLRDRYRTLKTLAVQHTPLRIIAQQILALSRTSQQESLHDETCA